MVDNKIIFSSCFWPLKSGILRTVESSQYLSMKMNKNKILLNEFKSIILKDNELIKIFGSKIFLLFSEKY